MVHPVPASHDRISPWIALTLRPRGRCALRLGLRGEWASAHEIVQADEGAEAVWVHAWLHRIEGDGANSAYWHGRAGKAVAEDSTDAEGEAIAQALSGS